MDVGLFLHSHGLVRHEPGGPQWVSLDAGDMRLAETAALAERAGFHSLWLPDHVLTTRVEHAGGVRLEGAARMRPPGCVMLDSLALLSWLAAATTRIELGLSVLVAPYRDPLVVAQQLATVDVLSGGRVLAGVGAGWLESEFDALGLTYADRGAITDECLAIYELAWTRPWFSHHGRHFTFDDVAVEPKPLRRIPRFGGGASRVAARRAVERCDGFMPRLEQASQDPPGRFAPLLEELRRHAARRGRDLAGFRLLTLADCRIGVRRTRFLSGSAEQIIDDLVQLAELGCTHCTLRLDTGSGDVPEVLEAIARIGDEVIPQAAQLQPAAL
jgi:probable F420-dependent oxidoreductase